MCVFLNILSFKNIFKTTCSYLLHQRQTIIFFNLLIMKQKINLIKMYNISKL